MNTSQPRSLLARVIQFIGGRRGAEDAASPPLQPSEQPPSPPAPSDEHLKYAPYFDQAKARNAGDNFGMSHDVGEDAYVYSVGYAEWVPLSVAVMLLGTSGKDALECVRSRTDKQQYSDKAFSDWVEVNRDVFNRLCNYQVDSKLFDIDHATMTEADWAIHREDACPWPMRFDTLGPAELSVLYRKAWRRFFAPVPEDFLAVSLAHATFYELAEVKEMKAAVDQVFTKVESIARLWLEAHGFTVDHDLGLVNVKGYQPLVLCGSYDY